MKVWVRKLKKANENPKNADILGEVETKLMPAISGKIKFKNKNYTILSIDIEQKDNSRRKIINVVE